METSIKESIKKSLEEAKKCIQEAEDFFCVFKEKVNKYDNSQIEIVLNSLKSTYINNAERFHFSRKRLEKAETQTTNVDSKEVKLLIETLKEENESRKKMKHQIQEYIIYASNILERRGSNGAKKLKI